MAKQENGLYRLVYDALVWYGAIQNGWRIKIERMIQTGYQYATVEVSVYLPRKRKPSVSWMLYTDTFRQNIDFERSTFTQLREI